MVDMLAESSMLITLYCLYGPVVPTTNSGLDICSIHWLHVAKFCHICRMHPIPFRAVDFEAYQMPVEHVRAMTSRSIIEEGLPPGFMFQTDLRYHFCW